MAYRSQRLVEVTKSPDGSEGENSLMQKIQEMKEQKRIRDGMLAEKEKQDEVRK